MPLLISLCDSTRYMLLIGFTVVKSSLLAELGRSRYAGLLFLADARTQRSNSAEFGTEQTGSHAPKQQYNIWLLFKIKHSMLTPAQKSQKKRQIRALLLILRSGSLCVVVFITHTYNCSHEWLCDYRGKSSVLSCPTILHRGRPKTQPMGVARLWIVEQNQTGAITQTRGHLSGGISELGSLYGTKGNIFLSTSKMKFKK